MTSAAAPAPPPDPRELLDVGVRAAEAAGELLVAGRPADLRVASTKTSPTDVVTEMDRASEQLIVRILLEARPNDAIVGEEGAAEAGGSGVRWIVDPIDGTVNYLYGLPGWSVSIAAEVDGVVVAGVVAVPSLGEVYTAVRGGGAWRDGTAISCGGPVPLDRALVATGFGYQVRLRERQAELLRQVLPRVRDIRRYGSCAVDLCSVAAGRVDGYYEEGTQLWDVAAGALIAAEAGALVAGPHQGPHDKAPDLAPDPAGSTGALTVAASPAVFGPLRALLAAAAG